MLSVGGKGEKFVAHLLLIFDIELSGSAEDLSSTGFSSFVLNDPNENAAFLPFGSGARACIGQKFIIQLVASVLASLLNKYEVCPMKQHLCSCFLCNERKTGTQFYTIKLHKVKYQVLFNSAKETTYNIK